jgi:hypothetical protein
MTDPVTDAPPRSRLPLVLLLVFAIAGVGAWLVLSAPEKVVPVPMVQPQKPTFAITAVKQAPDLPTYVQTGYAVANGAAVGGKLALLREGKPVATLLIESCDTQGSTCRVLADSWATGAATAITVGETVAVP